MADHMTNITFAELSQSESGRQRDLPNFGVEFDTEPQSSFLYFRKKVNKPKRSSM